MLHQLDSTVSSRLSTAGRTAAGARTKRPEATLWRLWASLSRRLQGKWPTSAAWESSPPGANESGCIPDRHAGAHWSAQNLKQTLGSLKEEKAMQTDQARLAKACCSPAKYPLLDGAPSPTTSIRLVRGLLIA